MSFFHNLIKPTTKKWIHQCFYSSYRSIRIW